VTAVQLALCEPTWNDPEPDDEDNGPWCRPPLQNDLWGQGLYNRETRRIVTVPTVGSYL
jgi:hypothetical protein